MWIDDDGRAHTVALPDPMVLMTEDFHVSMDALTETHYQQVREVLEQVEAAVFEQDLSSLASADAGSRYQAASAPPGLLTGSVASPQELRQALDRISLRWRLDAVMALDDYVG